MLEQDLLNSSFSPDYSEVSYNCSAFSSLSQCELNYSSNLTVTHSGYINVTNEMPISYAIPLYGYFMPILLVITMVFNTLIVVVLSRKHMRTPTNIVLMSMALCDMFTLLVPAPWLIYMYTLGNHYKPLYPVAVCYTWSVMHESLPNMFHTASIWLTLVLAVQRYIYVCHAPLARRLCTLPNVYKCVGYTLVASSLHQLPRMFDTDYSLTEISWHNRTVSVCVKNYASWVQEILSLDVYYICYYMFRLIFVHMLPCIALVTLNLLLFRALKQAQKRRDILLNSKKNQKNECKKLRDSNCTTLMLIVVVSVFLLVEIPLAVVTMLHIISSSIIEFLDYDVANTLIIFTNFFIILSYPINFAIYCGMSRQFRETFKEIFINGNEGARNGSSRYSIVNGPRTCTNETVL
ncbi:sex peptide receptor [Anthonomus grandis grandis]|uniref:sex peptide receptor n=1 Tax=Anthonomus grandis grandis TaxID=2921223 RepID=UPI0021656797|nr:sex peptide receptor [Anthonomus grandis grandis]XP_050312243.1 sex peptide receptor [Anthonomus grandis grandis]XP_050312244.1 sex peptide receptor [Anthonomus grandis grandis]XP_050312245.1 sex peptide receptor [Anthonomus grandis grandis]XP_050312246.1 sex peptide receptor [Anthonomus grandis grandis]XP_050312247.1 sex peptide receptor [Anthonomus grandis grandis]XP_050312248.1 sex peptide receptor [Anthonomus grandis grandis]